MWIATPGHLGAKWLCAAPNSETMLLSWAPSRLSRVRQTDDFAIQLRQAPRRGHHFVRHGLCRGVAWYLGAPPRCQARCSMRGMLPGRLGGGSGASHHQRAEAFTSFPFEQMLQ